MPAPLFSFIGGGMYLMGHLHGHLGARQSWRASCLPKRNGPSVRILAHLRSGGRHRRRPFIREDRK